MDINKIIDGKKKKHICNTVVLANSLRSEKPRNHQKPLLARSILKKCSQLGMHLGSFETKEPFPPPRPLRLEPSSSSLAVKGA